MRRPAAISFLYGRRFMEHFFSAAAAGIFIQFSPSLSLSLSFRSNSCLAAFMLQSARLQASRIGGRTEGSTNSKRSDYLDVWITPGTICHAAHFAAESGGRAVHVYDTLRCLSPSRSRSPFPPQSDFFGRNCPSDPERDTRGMRETMGEKERERDRGRGARK